MYHAENRTLDGGLQIILPIWFGSLYVHIIFQHFRSNQLVPKFGYMEASSSNFVCDVHFTLSNNVCNKWLGNYAYVLYSSSTGKCSVLSGVICSKSAQYHLF